MGPTRPFPESCSPFFGNFRWNMANFDRKPDQPGMAGPFMSNNGLFCVNNHLESWFEQYAGSKSSGLSNDDADDCAKMQDLAWILPRKFLHSRFLGSKILLCAQSILEGDIWGKVLSEVLTLRTLGVRPSNRIHHLIKIIFRIMLIHRWR